MVPLFRSRCNCRMGFIVFFLVRWYSGFMSKFLRAFFIVLAVVIFAALVYVIWSAVSMTPQTAPPPSATSTPTSTLAGGYDPGPMQAWKTWNGNNFDKATGITTSYSLKYPRDFDARSGDQAGGGNFIGEPHVSFNFPEDAFDQQKTNFAGASVLVSVATATSSSACYQDPQDPSKALGDTESINNIPFRVGTAGDAGAGNFYESRIYRTLFNTNCYELAAIVHTTNVGNYEPGTVTEFDKAQAWGVLDRIVRTVTLSTSSPQ